MTWLLLLFSHGIYSWFFYLRKNINHFISPCSFKNSQKESRINDVLFIISSSKKSELFKTIRFSSCTQVLWAFSTDTPSLFFGLEDVLVATPTLWHPVPILVGWLLHSFFAPRHNPSELGLFTMFVVVFFQFFAIWRYLAKYVEINGKVSPHIWQSIWTYFKTPLFCKILTFHSLFIPITTHSHTRNARDFRKIWVKLG